MTEKTVKASQYIIDLARSAKSFIAAAGEESLPDESLMRAAVTFNMLQRRGMIAAVVRNDDTMCKPHDFDDFDRAHAIALIAHNFTDHPPSTPERAALFGTVLPDDYAHALEEAVAGNRCALGLPPQTGDKTSSTDAAAQWTSMAISMRPVVVPEALDAATRAERERVLALVGQMLRECAGLHSLSGAGCDRRRLEALIEDIKCGARTYP